MDARTGAATSTMQDVDLNVADILQHGAQNYGDSTVSTLHGDRISVTTFEDIAERAGRLGAALQALGVKPGDVIGTLAWNTREHLESYFAVPGVGAVLHTLNLRFSVEQLSWCLNDAKTSILIVDETLLDIVVRSLASTPHVRTVIWFRNGEGGDAEENTRLLSERGVTVLEYGALVAAHEPLTEWVRVPERAGAALCYTSGTTGNPKGVVYSHRSIWLHSLVNTSAMQFGLSSVDTILPAVPMFHVMGWNLFYSAFMVGSGLVLTNRFTQARHLLAAIQSVKPTFGAGVPTIWNDIAHEYGTAGGTSDLTSLTRISSGGATVPESLIRWWQTGHGITILHGCGMTETSSTMTSGLPERSIGDRSFSTSQRTQGKFVIGVQARIVDADGIVLPRNGTAAGELQLRGPWVASGYLTRGPELTPDGWLPTGDIASIDEHGYLTYTDRIKDVIKSGGEWISSLALEAHLASHPDVREAVVVAVEDERWQERPVAIIVARDDVPTVESLQDHVAAAFPRFWVPDRWVFVDSLPRTSVGKFDKKALRSSLPELLT